jgi:hypothetical protein
VALAAPLPTVVEHSRSRLWDLPAHWHLLSLDAPTVAVLWAWSFARAADVHPSGSALAVLGIGTWLLYVADRLLDARSPVRHPLRERHFFHARHRRAFLTISAGAALLLLALIGLMPTAVRREDTLVFAVSMLYFALVHVPAVRVECWFPRELTVGAVFACATAIPAWSTLGSPHAELILPVLLFAGLCSLNCIAIEAWERPTPATRTHTVSNMAVALAIASAALMLIPDLRTPGTFRLLLSTFVSATLLFALDRLHRFLTHPDSEPANTARFLLALRVAADAALLTPLLFVLPWHP